MMKRESSVLREKLTIVLNERANQLKKTAKELARGTISIEEALESMYQNDYNDYNDYVQGLRSSEKEKILEEISMEAGFWQQFIGELEDANLTALMISSPKIAEICYTLPNIRFDAVLKLMAPEKLFELFCASNDVQREDILNYIEVKELRNLFACVCTLEYDEKIEFFKELDRFADDEEVSADDEEVSADDEEVSADDEEVSEDDGENQESVDSHNTVEEKILNAIHGLDAKDQAELIQKMSRKWTDPILAQSATVPDMLVYLSENDTVEIMLNCNEEHFDELFRALAKIIELFNWSNVFITDQVELLKLIKERGFLAKDIFTIPDLVDVYCQLEEEEDQNFVLYEILVDFEQQEPAKTEIYKRFEVAVRKYFAEEEVPVATEMLFLHFLVDQKQQANLKEMFEIPDLVGIYYELSIEDEEEKVFVLDQVLSNLEEDENQAEAYRLFETELRRRPYSREVLVIDEIRFLRFLIRQNKQPDIKYIFGLDELVRVYCVGKQEDKKYILNEILPVLEQDKADLVETYREFYKSIPTGENKVKFLEMHYDRACSEKAEHGSIWTAEVISQMLSQLENTTTTERLYIESFKSLIPESAR